jgi:hypothetical protein
MILVNDRAHHILRQVLCTRRLVLTGGVVTPLNRLTKIVELLV